MEVGGDPNQRRRSSRLFLNRNVLLDPRRPGVIQVLVGLVECVAETRGLDTEQRLEGLGTVRTQGGLQRFHWKRDLNDVEYNA